MRTYTYTLVLEGPELQEEHLERLFEAGCDDAAFGSRGEMQIADFDREAPTFATALVTSIMEIESAVPGLRVVRVEPDDFVTAAAIAERTERSRESVRLLVTGERGPGDFPGPITWLDGSSKIWRWHEVAEWFADRMGENVDPSGGAPQFVAALNSVLEARRQLSALSAVAADSEDASSLAFTADTVEALPAMVTRTADEVRRTLSAA